MSEREINAIERECVMAVIKVTELLAKAEEESKNVEIEAVDGSLIMLRGFNSLPGADLKLVLKYMDILQDKKVSETEKVNVMDQCLVTAADRKEAMAEILDVLPMSSREVLLDAWMEAAEVPES